MATLYDLTQEAGSLLAALVAVEEMADDDDGDHARGFEAAEESLRKQLMEVAERIRDKSDAYAWIIRELDAEAEAMKAREQEFGLKRRARENAAKRLKGALIEAMQAVGADTIQGSEFKLAIQASPPRVAEVDAEAALAAGLAETVTTIKADGKAIVAAWKAGTLADGVALVEQGCHLRIR